MAQDRFNGDSHLHHFTKLQALILQRREFEAQHTEPPYSLHKTDYDFTDIDGNALLHYAAAIGDIDKIKDCLHNNSSIDLKNSVNETAIMIACQLGNLKVAIYLFEQGASCKDLDLAYFSNNTAMIAWVSEKIKVALQQSFSNPKENNFFPAVENQFFKTDFFSNPADSALKRAIEIGDIDFIKTKIINKLMRQKQIYASLITAAKNGQIEIIKYLYLHYKNHSRAEYSSTPLIEAIKYKQQAVIDFLLEQKVDVNQEDHYKHTAISYAVMHSDRDVVNQLIQQGALLNKKNVVGNTLLHLAVTNQSTCLKELLDYPSCRSLIEIKNSYGQTPLTLAMQKKADKLIQLLAPEMDLASIKNRNDYGVQPIDISQDSVLNKLKYWLRIKYRNFDYFEETGHCNGFAYLKSFYAAAGMEQYYFDTLSLIATWNGSEESLLRPLQGVKQAAYYRNLDELFEQWTNDIIWFQHTKNIDDINQHDRISQYAIIKNSTQDDFNYHLFYQEPYKYVYEKNKYITYDRTLAQLEEIFSYLLRMPAGVHIEIGGGQHATSGYINHEDTFIYYDPNSRFKTDKASNLREIIQRIVDYKYIFLNKFNGTVHCLFCVHCYQKDLEKINIDHFSIFTDQEFPASKEDADAFQKNSPNHFTQLHIAVMTRSLPAVKRLLDDGFCDVNAKDHLGRCVIKMALDSSFIAAINLFLSMTHINEFDLDYFISQAYDKKQYDLVKLIVSHPNVTNMNMLLCAAIKENDIDLFNYIMSNKKANVNQAINNNLALIEAMEKNNNVIIESLLASGADLFISANDIGKTTPLAAAFVYKSDYVDLILSKLPDINQQDINGKAAIHYAADFLNVDALKKIINQGADVHLKTLEGNNAMDCVMKSYVWNDDKLNDCLMLLIPHYHFSQSDLAKINEILSKSISLENQSLYQLILSQCDKATLNKITISGESLLLYLMMQNKFHMIQPLLEKGVYVDVVFASGNTPLMGLIKVKNLPEKYDLISLFIRHQASFLIKNKEGKTAIDLVNESDDEKIKQIFYDHHLIAKPNQQQGVILKKY